MAIKCALVLILLIVAYQDFRFRAVHWFLFPLLLFFSLYNLHYMNLLKDSLFNLSFNVLFILVQLLFLMFYFSVKHSRLINITDTFIGWGDILFLLNLCFLLPPVNFILFYLLSLILIVFGYIIYTKIRRTTSSIPLAGLQALLFVILFLLDLRSSNSNLYNDSIGLEVLHKWII